MIIKAFKVATLAFVIFSFYLFFTYFNGLDFKRDAPLEACWGIDLIDPETGEKIVGVEDIAFDSKAGTVFLSAYDRRLVDKQEEGPEVTVRGGIYSFNIQVLNDRPSTLTPAKLTTDIPEGKFLPHGISFSRFINRRKLVAVNRVYKDGLPPDLDPEIREFGWDGKALSEGEVFNPIMICHPNDVDVYWNGFFVTNDRGYCRTELSPWEQFWDESGTVYRHRSGEFKIVATDLPFPNGVAVVKRRGGDLLAVSLTQADQIRLYDIASGELYREIDVPGAPDNLAVDEEGNIYFTVFPNILDFFFYTKDMFLVKKTPTGVFRIFAQSDWHTIQLLYHDNGKVISGATVAQPAWDYLLVGAAWDDNIAACKGLRELGGLREFEE